MKVQGTKPVKDEGSGDRAQTEDPEHKPNWRAELQAACKKVFCMYDQTSHSKWRQLYDEVCAHYGQRLGECERTDRMLVYERIATNTLIRAMKQHSR